MRGGLQALKISKAVHSASVRVDRANRLAQFSGDVFALVRMAIIESSPLLHIHTGNNMVICTGRLYIGGIPAATGNCKWEGEVSTGSKSPNLVLPLASVFSDPISGRVLPAMLVVPGEHCNHRKFTTAARTEMGISNKEGSDPSISARSGEPKCKGKVSLR